ncbi:MAG: hypothetical protein FWD17_19255, partial [Polyangiaceae bacterium]|nr:hypothetical protein [Polyangiaceae bacterium]
MVESPASGSNGHAPVEAEGGEDGDGEGGEGSEGEPAMVEGEASSTAGPIEGGERKRRRRRRKKKGPGATGAEAAPAAEGPAEAEGAENGVDATAEAPAGEKSELRPKRNKERKPAPMRERPPVNGGDIVFGKIIEITD